jgi:hypothetical protein
MYHFHPQLSYSTVQDVRDFPVVGVSAQGDGKTSQGSLGSCTNLQSGDVAWQPMNNDREQWMELDLMEQHDIAGINTVGSVKTMQVLFRSSPLESWTDYFLSDSKPFNAGQVLFEVPVLARCVLVCDVLAAAKAIINSLP